MVANGDRISYSMPERRIDLLVPEPELQKRLKKWNPPIRKIIGYLARYASLTSSVTEGAILRTPKGLMDTEISKW